MKLSPDELSVLLGPWQEVSARSGTPAVSLPGVSSPALDRAVTGHFGSRAPTSRARRNHHIPRVAA